jgi:hypothetical protein
MLRKEELELFLGKPVSIGVPHAILPDKLFFYYGILKFVSENEVKLETNNGFKLVPIDQIMDIHGDRRHND